MPSLLQGSAQMLYITKFKTEPLDMTCGISVLICKAPNADFDGDELNFTMLLDNNIAEEFTSFAPYFNAQSAGKPYEISGYLTLLSPSYGILSNYVLDKSPSAVPANKELMDRFTFV